MADEEAPNAYTVVYQDGDKETVQWLSRAGNARVTYPNGDTYEGTFNEMGQRHGSGEYTYKSAAQDGEEEDAGDEDEQASSKPAARYVGNFRLGKKQGFGKFYYPDGSVFSGMWENDARHGHGSYTYPNGDAFSGNWVAGKKSGTGSYRYAANGSQLNGTWVDDKFVTGSWVQQDSTSFSSKWDGSRPVGKGIFQFKSGNTLEGKFETKEAEGEDEEESASAAPTWSGEALRGV